MTLSVDVVVPTFERWELTERCLSHLARQSIGHKVFVVDGASTDGTPANVRRAFPNVEVLELEANFGFTVACNRGAAAGSGDVIVLLNNDAFCRPDFLRNVIAAFEADPRIGSVAPLALCPDELTINGLGIAVDPTLASFTRLSGRPAAEARATHPVLAGPGAGADCHRRSAWEEVGGYDEIFPMYMCDTDLALRLACAGWQTAAAPDAICIHLGSATTGRRSTVSRAIGGRGRGYMLRRYRVLRKPVALRTLATEAIVIAGEIVLSRDGTALRSRIRGWRAGGKVPSRAWPPPGVIDPTITFRQSLRLRWTQR